MIDLHLHLDGSLTAQDLLDVAPLADFSLTTCKSNLESQLTAPKTCTSLSEYLTRFDLPLRFMQTPSAVEFLTKRLCERLIKQGLRYAEIRFAPSLHLSKGFSQAEIIEGALRAISAFSYKKDGFFAGLILCCMRGTENKNENFATLEIAKTYLDRGVCAIDLAGAESLYPTKNFADLFKRAYQENIPFTIHAGEADNYKSVLYAIEFGAKRIGHGIRSAQNSDCVKLLARENIPLEICYSSNLQTKAYEGAYPFRQLLDSGVTLTVNTDNMTVSDTTLSREFSLLKKDFSLTTSEILSLKNNSANSAFLPDNMKSYLQFKD